MKLRSKTITGFHAIPLIALALAGCGLREGDGHSHAGEGGGHVHETAAGITFDSKHGLSIPVDTAKFVGLQIADVTERTIAATFEFSARVYRGAVGSANALASGNVSPTEAARLYEGQTISARGGSGGVELSGQIVALNRGLEKASGQVEVLLAVSDPQGLLVAGTFFSATASLGGETNVVSVPRSALFRTTEGDFVYTVSGAHYVRTPVKLGVTNQEFAEIADGLYTGDQIVVQSAMTLWLAELQTLRGGKSCADGH